MKPPSLWQSARMCIRNILLLHNMQCRLPLLLSWLDGKYMQGRERLVFQVLNMTSQEEHPNLQHTWKSYRPCLSRTGSWSLGMMFQNLSSVSCFRWNHSECPGFQEGCWLVAQHANSESPFWGDGGLFWVNFPQPWCSVLRNSEKLHSNMECKTCEICNCTENLWLPLE